MEDSKVLFRNLVLTFERAKRIFKQYVEIARDYPSAAMMVPATQETFSQIEDEIANADPENLCLTDSVEVLQERLDLTDQFFDLITTTEGGDQLDVAKMVYHLVLTPEDASKIFAQVLTPI